MPRDPFHSSDRYLAWGRAHRFTHRVARPETQADAGNAVAAARAGGQTVLPYGQGRSYGDCALNRGGALIDTGRLDRFIAFDRKAGLLEAEAGVTLADMLRVLAGPDGKGGGNGSGWFLPVTPGTKFVSLGGAIANDVHGKNHHRAGCWGSHVVSLRLARSDGTVLTCSADENPALFRATLGGLGLTGLILSAVIRLKAVPGLWLESEDIRYGSLDDFHALTDDSLADWEYSVAWIDCLAKGAELGRGIFSRARHIAADPGKPPGIAMVEPRLALPVDLPGFALNRFSIAAFNALYWRKAPVPPQTRILPFEPVFYPLDAIGQWNRLYGRCGFYQYQCAIPAADAADAVRALLQTIADAGQGSFLAVLKTLGDRPSPGLLSFPLPGTTLALDFPNRGAVTHALLDRLDTIVAAAGGRVYPAKDGRVRAGTFQRGYPQWTAFAEHIDPAFSSSFWRRVSAAVQGETRL